MTVLTKPFSDKKAEKPLTLGLEGSDAESGNVMFLTRQQKMSAPTTIMLFAAALMVLLMGIMGGIAVYRSCARARLNRFHGFCGVPYDSNTLTDDVLYLKSPFRDDSGEPGVIPFADNLLAQLAHNDPNGMFFKEEFELGLGDDRSYSKIDVPDFHDGRTGRFYHDFKYNQSAIVDLVARRCFVMPLDRSVVEVPRNLFDLIMKMQKGEYNIDTTVVKKNMRVVLPAVRDMSTIAPGIVDECENKRTYMLEKYVSGVFKRSADTIPSSGKFAVFGGRHIAKYDLQNIDAVDVYESITD